jgi:hypothetical protein
MTSSVSRTEDQEDVVDASRNVSVEELSEPLTFPVEAYLSEEYARAEGGRLWAKVSPERLKTP